MDEACKLSLSFFSDQQLCYADILTPPEVIARIQVAVLNFLRILTASAPAISDLPLVARKWSNSRLSQGLLTQTSWIFLRNAFCTRSLNRPNATKAFIRVWKAMAMCFKILGQEKKVTQRELFYKLLCESPDYFPSQSQVNRTVQGHGISGDLNSIDKLTMKTEARYIIVVEKHAIFQRLVEDRVFNQIPSILITAKGYPDIGTRLLLHRMSRVFPDLPILALVDWNPAGLAILCTFKYGSIGMGLEAYRYACNVKWLGLRADDLDLIPEQALVPLKAKDLQIAKSLMSSEILQENYREELALMVESSKRAEIEALYVHGYDYLGKFIAKRIVQANYI